MASKFTHLRLALGLLGKREREIKKMYETLNDIVERAAKSMEQAVAKIKEAEAREAYLIQRMVNQMTETPGSPGVLVVRGLTCTGDSGGPCSGLASEHDPESTVTLDPRVPYGKVGYLAPDGQTIIDRDTREVLSR